MAAKTKKEDINKEEEKASKSKPSSESKSERKVAKPAAVKSAAKPAVAKKATVEKEVAKPATAKKATVEKEVAKPATTKKETVKKETAKPATAKKETAKKEVVKPAAKKATVDKEVAKPAVAKKETAKKEVVKPAAKKAKKSKDADDNITRSDIAANDISDILSKSEIKEKERTTKKSNTDVEIIEYIDNSNYNGPRYSDEDLELFKEKILKAKQEAHEELVMLKERLDDYNNIDFAEESQIYSMHMAEQGPEALEQEKTFAQVQRISEYIKKLEDALLRIKDKTYGICRKCKCLIAKERLLAVPVTTLSASYKIHKKCPDDGIDKIEPIKK